jgi:hypothetical protein
MSDRPEGRRPATAPQPATSSLSGTGGRRTWLAYVLLFALSIPWYFPAGSGRPLVLGFPLWCLVSLVCYVLVALLTVRRIERLWEEQEPGDGGEADERTV